MSIGGWSPNDCDPNSDLSPTLEEIERAMRSNKSSCGASNPLLLIVRRLDALVERYPSYPFRPFQLMVDGRVVSLLRALIMLEEVEAQITEAWLAGKLRRAG